MPIKGKQVIDNTITQLKLNLIDPLLPQDAATKKYVDENQSVETNSTSNKTMFAQVTAADGDVAVIIALTDQPVAGSGVSVVVNGIRVPCGNGVDDVCYFSPDGTFKRAHGNERQGDVLYWIGSVANFQLDLNDIIDYNYVISNQNARVVLLEDGDVFMYSVLTRQNLFTFDGVDGDTATIIIDGTSFDTGNIGGNFVFDIGNINGYQHTFTVVGESIPVVVNSVDYVVVWDGTGSLLFSISEDLVEITSINGGGADSSDQTDPAIDGGEASTSGTGEPIDGGQANPAAN